MEKLLLGREEIGGHGGGLTFQAAHNMYHEHQATETPSS